MSDAIVADQPTEKPQVLDDNDPEAEGRYIGEEPNKVLQRLHLPLSAMRPAREGMGAMVGGDGQAQTRV